MRVLSEPRQAAGQVGARNGTHWQLGEGLARHCPGCLSYQIQSARSIGPWHRHPAEAKLE